MSGAEKRTERSKGRKSQRLLQLSELKKLNDASEIALQPKQDHHRATAEEGAAAAKPYESENDVFTNNSSSVNAVATDQQAATRPLVSPVTVKREEEFREDKPSEDDTKSNILVLHCPTSRALIRSQSPPVLGSPPSRSWQRPGSKGCTEPPHSTPSAIDKYPRSRSLKPASPAKRRAAKKILHADFGSQLEAEGLPRDPAQTATPAIFQSLFGPRIRQYLLLVAESLQVLFGKILQALCFLLWACWIMVPQILPFLPDCATFREKLIWLSPLFLNLMAWKYPNNRIFTRLKFILPAMSPTNTIGFAALWLCVHLWSLVWQNRLAALEYVHFVVQSFQLPSLIDMLRRYGAAVLTKAIPVAPLAATIPPLARRRYPKWAIIVMMIGTMLNPLIAPGTYKICQLPGVRTICQVNFSDIHSCSTAWLHLHSGIQSSNTSTSRYLPHTEDSPLAQIDPFKALGVLATQFGHIRESTLATGIQLEKILRQTKRLLQDAYLEVKVAAIPFQRDIRLAMHDIDSVLLPDVLRGLESFSVQADHIVNSVIDNLVVTIGYMEEIDKLDIAGDRRLKVQKDLMRSFITSTLVMREDCDEMLNEGARYPSKVEALQKEWFKLALLMRRSREYVESDKRDKARFGNYLGYYSSDVDKYERDLMLISDIEVDYWKPIREYLLTTEDNLRGVMATLNELHSNLNTLGRTDWELTPLDISRTLLNLQRALQDCQGQRSKVDPDMKRPRIPARTAIGTVIASVA